MILYDGTVIPSAITLHPIKTNLNYADRYKDELIHIGTILSVRPKDETEDPPVLEELYSVRIDIAGSMGFIYHNCRLIKSFYGINNYINIIPETVKDAENYSASTSFDKLPISIVGSRCIVAFIDGLITSPVIIGFLTHPAMKSTIEKGKGQVLDMMFNGFNATIDKDGQLFITADKPPLKAKEGDETEPAKQNTKQTSDHGGPLKITITKDQEIEILDGQTQTFKISPKDKKILISNNSESMTFDKEAKTIKIIANKEIKLSCETFTNEISKLYSLKADEIKIKAQKSTITETSDFIVNANATVKIKAPKIAIGSSSTELLDLLYQIFDAMSKLTINTRIGPADPVMVAPQWSTTVMPLLIKLKVLTGSL